MTLEARRDERIMENERQRDKRMKDMILKQER